MSIAARRMARGESTTRGPTADCHAGVIKYFFPQHLHNSPFSFCYFSPIFIFFYFSGFSKKKNKNDRNVLLAHSGGTLTIVPFGTNGLRPVDVTSLADI